MKNKSLFRLIVLLLLHAGISRAQFTKLLDFSGLNGQTPQSPLISDGTYLYGTTRAGGTSGMGNVFKILPNGNGYADILNFNGSNGSNPLGTLYYDGVYIYGVTNGGGSGYEGTVYKIKTDGTGYKKIFDFTTTNTKAPASGLISDGTNLYGTTYTGGSGLLGVLFKLDTSGSGYTVVYNFGGTTTSGSHPNGVVYDGTYLYGTTSGGGANSNGTVFKIEPGGTGYTDLYDLSSVSGDSPQGGLFYDGTYLYGTGTNGGINSLGTIFKIKTDGSGFTKLFNFSGTVDGANPYGSLISDGTFLYGITKAGGTNNLGSIFKIMPDGSGFTKLFDFSGAADGSNPLCSLFSDGVSIYGTASFGGSQNDGTIFKSSMSVGIEEKKLLANIEVYPNPTEGLFYFTLNDEIMAQGSVYISIINTLGQEIYSTRLNQHKSLIDFSKEPEGFYFLTMRQNDVILHKTIIID